MTTTQLLTIALAIGVASFVQVIAGFGFSLLAMPIMTITVPVDQAVVVASLLAMLTTSWQSWALRRHADRALVTRLATAAFLGMPLGLFVLNVVPDQALRLVLGVSVLVATALLAGRLSLAHVGPGLDYGAGFLSGVLNTSLSTNGPPLVFDLQARHLEPDAFRATLAVVFALSNVVALILYGADGKIQSTEVRAALIALPAWGVGQLIGWPVRRHVHGERFRRVVLALLAVAGTTTIVFALT